MEILYKPTFIRQLNKLDNDLQEEVFEKIDLFKIKDNHSLLKVHKLHRELREFYSFSVNYKIRIVFIWSKNDEVILFAIGDHDVYK